MNFKDPRDILEDILDFLI